MGENPDREILFDDLRNMVYVEAVVKETMRLYTIIPFFDRRLEETAHIGKRERFSNLKLSYSAGGNPNVRGMFKKYADCLNCAARVGFRSIRLVSLW